MSAIKIFISYSHDSAEHRDRVLGLAERMRRDGFDAQIDHYVPGTPTEGWPRWMMNQLDAAHYVLVVCTETYDRRFRGLEAPGKGKGVDWEGAIITQEIYDSKSTSTRFVPVIFAPEDACHVPVPLRGATYYLLDREENLTALYDFLHGVAGVEPAPLGDAKRRERARGTALSFGAPPGTGSPSSPAPSITGGTDPR